MWARGKKTQLEIYDGCYEELHHEENVLGRVVFKEDEFMRKAVKVPAGETLYFRYGTTDPNWTCHGAFSLTSEPSQNYFIDYEMKFAGCEVIVYQILKDKVVLAPFTSLKSNSEEYWTGDSDTGWRKCKYLKKN